MTPIRIIEVENGYIIHEDHPGRMDMDGKKWVAGDIPTLMSLVGDIAVDRATASALECES